MINPARSGPAKRRPAARTIYRFSFASTDFAPAFAAL
jgi:hypothetical protein